MSTPSGISGTEPPIRDQVFLSYSHKDEYWLEELQTMLKPLVKRRTLALWSDKRIQAGDEWRAEIHEALSLARVAILLVSKHFLASNFIQEDELPAMLAMRAAGLKILWVPVSSSMYDHTDLRHLQALHDASRPLDMLNQAERERALLSICEKIRDLLVEFPAGNAGQPLPAENPRPVLPEHKPKEAEPQAPRDAEGRHKTETNLLFGVLAVQMEYIDSSQFTEACASWAVNKSRPLADIVVERGWLSPEDREDIEKCVLRKLRKHQGSVAATLHASADSTLREAMRQSQVPEILESLDELCGHSETALHAPLASASMDWRSVFREGKLGQIWRGFDPALGREVALKVVRPDRAGQAPARGRLMQEARIAGRLEHPHIVPVYALGQRDDGDPYYVMRLVHGPTLADDIARHHQTRLQNRVDVIERRRLLQCLQSVCHAVAYAHSKGFLHLDLKPQNVVLGEFREVYLLDWGLAQPVPPKPDPDSSVADQPIPPSLRETISIDPNSRRLIGTPAYMSPEQAAGDPHQFETRTDVYGLGTILFEILTGQAPHRADDLEATLQAIQFYRPPSPRDILPSIPDSLNDLCLRALARNPADRFASAEDLGLAIERWLDDEPLVVYRSNIERYEQALLRNPEHLIFREGLARNLVTQGLVMHGLGRLSAAEFVLIRGIDVYKDLVEKRPESRYMAELGMAYVSLRHVYVQMGRADDADASDREAKVIYFKLKHREPEDGFHSLMSSMFEMAMFEAGQSVDDIDWDESQSAVREPNADDSADRTIADLNPVNRPPAARQAAALPVESRSESGKRESRPSPAQVPAQPAVLENQVSSKGAYFPPPTPQDTAFAVGNVIGGGGEGRIYSAFERLLRRNVALKEAHRPEQSDLVAREALIIADLEHPGINPVYTLAQWSDGRTYFTTRLILGGSDFRALIEDLHTEMRIAKTVTGWRGGVPNSRAARRRVQIKLRTAINILKELCSIVAYAHTRGVVHRDVKPQNVLVTRSGIPLLIDWGMAYIVAGSPAMERLGPKDELNQRVCGSPPYMSPEHFKVHAASPSIFAHLLNDPHTMDVFQLGATLYEILTGKPPYQGRTAEEYILQAKNGVVEPPETITTPIDPDLRAVCAKALSQSSADRYRTAGEIRDDLNRWLFGKPVSVRPGGLWNGLKRLVTLEPWKQAESQEPSNSDGARALR